MMDLLNLQPAIAEIFLALAALGLVLLSAFVMPQENASKLVRRLTLFSFLIAIFLIIYNGYKPAYAFNGQFFTSSFMVYMKVIILLGAIGILLMAKREFKQDQIDRPELPLLMLLSVLGMMLMVSANDIILLYMGLELQSLPLYVIAAIRRESLRSSEAGLKYFLLGALSSGLLLYGASLLYGFTGHTSYDGIKIALESNVSAGAVIGMVFLISGIAFKISAAPFHMWTPDVYEGSPTIVTAFFAVVPKLAAMTLFLRFTYGVLADASDSWQQIVMIIAVLSMLVGAGGAIMQTDIKRLMAYSSIAHMGYALVGIAAASDMGIGAVMLYMAIYVISSIGVFAIILSIKQEGRPLTRIEDLSGFSRSHPVYALAMMVLMFSMAGIPPMGGFFGKWYVFSAAVASGHVILAIIGVLASVIGAFYYIRIIKVMYVDEQVIEIDHNVPRRNTMIALASALVMAFFLFGLSILRDQITAAIPFVVFVAG
ncbi:MAG: NADH-quinone oxidoreductase subunit N [Candidatus Puniceispirillum sp. TMED52]|nr:NADH-quinone oxidoreductase subunit NuoN [SAR116 cluster bacterium]OUU51195.1 MAG: NADH-quinone oxidoreductase subunit N [Candidatus Puniceispirillum sp. TMED52]